MNVEAIDYWGRQLAYIAGRGRINARELGKPVQIPRPNAAKKEPDEPPEPRRVEKDPAVIARFFDQL